jgi:hypothetical protein
MRWHDRVHVLIRRRSGRGRSAVALTAALVAAALSGCASSDGVGALIIDPGHYSVYHCKDLKAQLAYLLGRQKQLRELTEKASEGSGGALIGNLSYRAEYEDMVGQEKVLRRSAAEKNCELPPPVSPAVPAAATSTVQPAASAPTSTPTYYQSDQTIR